MAKRAKLQPFTVETWKRSKVKGHPRNPRKITAAARGKLDRGLDRFGLLDLVLVNRRTTHVLSGHRRLEWADAREKGDYSLQVAVCNVPEKDEPAVLALMNNQAAMGEWDLPVLEDLIASGELDFEMAGFDATDLGKLFPKSEEIAALLGGSNGASDEAAGPQLDGFEYRVIVDVSGEEQQRALIEKLEAEGLICRPLIS